jgi:hypothetical protein
MRNPLTSTTRRRSSLWKFQQYLCSSHRFCNPQFHALNRIRTPHTLSRVTPRRTQLLSKQKLLRAAHVMGPTLTALVFMGASSAVAHAQGTMDFSGAQTLMGTFKTFTMYTGAVICLGGLIFAGIRMMTGRFQDAIPGLFGALFGAGVLGWGAGWIGVAYLASRLLSWHSPAGIEQSGTQRNLP